MEVIAVSLAAGVILSVLAGGSLTRILDTPVRAPALALAGLAGHLVLGLWAPGGEWPEPAGGAVFAGSLAALLLFALLNVNLTGMSVVAIGVGLNLAVVAANGAMPVRLPGDASAERVQALERSSTHEPEADAERFVFLGQTVPVPDPVARAVSFGDLIIGVGVIDALFHAGRRRRRPELAGEPAAEPAAEPVAELAGEGVAMVVPSAPSSGNGEPLAGDGAGQGGNDAAVVDTPTG